MKTFLIYYFFSLLAYSALGRVFGGNTDGGLPLSLAQSLIRGSLVNSAMFTILFLIPGSVASISYLLNKAKGQDFGRNLVYATSFTWLLALFFLYFDWYAINAAR